MKTMVVSLILEREKRTHDALCSLFYARVSPCTIEKPSRYLRPNTPGSTARSSRSIQKQRNCKLDARIKNPYTHLIQKLKILTVVQGRNHCCRRGARGTCLGLYRRQACVYAHVRQKETTAIENATSLLSNGMKFTVLAYKSRGIDFYRNGRHLGYLRPMYQREPVAFQTWQKGG